MRRAALLATALAVLLAAPAASAAPLEAGAARADMTPATGYYTMGYVRTDAKALGQHTRLYARVIVLKQGDKKVALIAGDVGAWPGGLIKHAAEANKDRGFSEQNVLASASHTHSAPTGFYNFGTYNTSFMQHDNPAEFKIVDTATDPQLYAFMLRQLAAAIRRADDDLAPAAAGWGYEEIHGLTKNRSIEAHLANHGLMVDFGDGSAEMDPLGIGETIDPEVHVLRVDKVRGRRRVPIGIWSTFADHGTVNRYTFGVYNRDHHGAATEVVERTIRRVGKVPRSQDVVNAYGNTDEGDMTAALGYSGPAEAEYVGRIEAAAMLRAWKQAGRRMSREPAFDSRWTRVCFCGTVGEDSRAVVGLPLFTGSDEARGPLYDVTGVPFEGRTGPDRGAQGKKIQVTDQTGSVPQAVPVMAIRLGDRMIVSVPGEMTSGMGARLRAAVLEATKSAGIARVVISGLANEFLQYFTTPEEYDRQHYEGGSVLYGRLAALLIQETNTNLARALVEGRPAATPYDFDPTNGVGTEGPPYPDGAERGQAQAQPTDVRRLQRAEFRWAGGERGYDRPVDARFVTIQIRSARGRWHHVTNDLGMQILWRVDDDGVYTAQWEVPLSQKRGVYRFVVTAKRYRLASRPFRVGASNALQAKLDGGMLRLAYPEAVEEVDFTWRPPFASGGSARVRVGGKPRTVRSRRGAMRIGGTPVELAAGAARDRYGNTNANAIP